MAVVTSRIDRTGRHSPGTASSSSLFPSDILRAEPAKPRELSDRSNAPTDACMHAHTHSGTRVCQALIKIGETVRGFRARGREGGCILSSRVLVHTWCRSAQPRDASTFVPGCRCCYRYRCWCLLVDSGFSQRNVSIFLSCSRLLFFTVGFVRSKASDLERRWIVGVDDVRHVLILSRVLHIELSFCRVTCSLISTARDDTWWYLVGTRLVMYSTECLTMPAPSEIKVRK